MVTGGYCPRTMSPRMPPTAPAPAACGATCWTRTGPRGCLSDFRQCQPGRAGMVGGVTKNMAVAHGGVAAPDDEQRYQAAVSKDPRFDGVFFIAVTSTGIYCRPSCPAITPERTNMHLS